MQTILIIFTDESFPFPDRCFAQKHSVSAKIKIDPDGIANIIQNLPNQSSPGADSISTKLLKLTQPYVGLLLPQLYRPSLDQGAMLYDWRQNIVTIVNNSGSTSLIISLTCVPCKILEHVLSTHIMNFFVDDDFIFINQHSFRKNRSCETQLFELFTDLRTSMHSRVQTDIFFS